jgi:hypothetical protein
VRSLSCALSSAAARFRTRTPARSQSPSTSRPGSTPSSDRTTSSHPIATSPRRNAHNASTGESSEARKPRSRQAWTSSSFVSCGQPMTATRVMPLASRQPPHGASGGAPIRRKAVGKIRAGSDCREGHRGARLVRRPLAPHAGSLPRALRAIGGPGRSPRARRSQSRSLRTSRTPDAAGVRLESVEVEGYD